MKCFGKREVRRATVIKRTCLPSDELGVPGAEADNTATVSSPSTRRLSAVLILCLAGIVLFTFHGVLGHEFVHYDDARNIVHNPNVDGLTGKNIHWMLTDTKYAPRYMPLGWLCYAVDRELFGLNPQLWHGGNLLVHLLNTLLLFVLLKEIVSTAQWQKTVENQRKAIWCAAIGALFWAVNPLRVEPVAWASARIYGVAVLFVLVWLICWLRSHSASTPGERRFYAWAALGAYAASLLTYPLALFAVVILLALDVFPLRRAPAHWSRWWQRDSWKLWREKIPFFLISGVVLALTMAVRIGSDERYRPATLAEFGLMNRIMQAGYLIAYYVWKPWAPLDLAAAYPTLHAFAPANPVFLLSAGFVAAASLAALIWYRRQPGLASVWFCHLIILVPVLGLSEYPHSAFDRYSHLHGLLWSGVIAVGLSALWTCRPRRYFAAGALAAACAAFAFLSYAQVPTWKNTRSLYNTIVSRFGEHPGRGRFDEVLAMQHLQAGQTNQGITCLSNAVYYDARRKDRHIYIEAVIPRSERKLADIFTAQGDFSNAVSHLEGALRTEPEIDQFTALSLQYSATLTKLGRESEAEPWLRRAIEISPDDASLHKELGVVLQKLGRNVEARGHFKEEQRLNAAASLQTKVPAGSSDASL